MPKPLKPITSDAATRTWPRDHGPMLGHRVNSEGLRRRAIAPGHGAPKRVYIVFALHYCQPSAPKKALWIVAKATILARSRTALVWHDAPPPAYTRNGNSRSEFGFRAMLRRTAATFLRRSLWNLAGQACPECRQGDQRQHRFQHCGSDRPAALTLRDGRGIVFGDIPR